MAHDTGSPAERAVPTLRSLLLSPDELRQVAGLPPASVPVSDPDAQRAGRRLALQLAVAGRSSNGHDVVPDVLLDAAQLLKPLGVHLEVVRVRPGFAALRLLSRGGTHGPAHCPLCKGLIETIPQATSSGVATVVEVACTARGDEACLYSLVWRRPSLAPSPAAAPERPPTFAPPPRTEGEAPGGSWSSVAAPPGPGATAWAVDADGAAAPEETEAGGIPPAGAGGGGDGGGDGSSGWSPGDRWGGEKPSSTAVVVASRAEPALEVMATDRDLPSTGPIVDPNRSLRTRRGAPWLWRRGWILVATLVAGAVGGWFAGARHATAYSAQATLVVRSGAGSSGPGSANDALALAITYSAVIPSDQQLLNAVARHLGTTEATVASRISASVETGTSVLQISYSAPTPSAARRGAATVATTLSGASAVSATIPKGSVVVVRLPTSATVANSMQKYGAPLGALLGLALGFVIVLAAERADPRVDDAGELAGAAGCPGTTVPGEVSDAELARAIARRRLSDEPITLVPLTEEDQPASVALAQRLAAAWPSPALSRLVVGPAFTSGRTDIARGSGPTVLVAGAGAAQRAVTSAAERLRLLGRPPLWAVLIPQARRRGR